MTAVRDYPWKRPRGWWLHNKHYTEFMLREIGGTLSAVYGIILLVLLSQYRAGSSAFSSFVVLMQSPLMLVASGVIFAFVLIHAFAWLMLIGKTQPVRFVSIRPPEWRKAFAFNIGLFILVSVLIVLILFGGF